MAYLTIKLRVDWTEVYPDEVRLNLQSLNPLKQLYCIPSNVVGNMDNPHIEGKFGELFCRRRILFTTGTSKMIEGETKYTYSQLTGKGKITMVKNNDTKTIPGFTTFTTKAIESIGWRERLLCAFEQNIGAANTTITIRNPARFKCPHYLLTSDIQQLRENVYFYIKWADRLIGHTARNNKKVFDITFLLFDTPNE